MRNLTSDTLERIRLLQADLQQIQQEHALLDERQKAVEKRLDAMQVLLEWERDREGIAVHDETLIMTNDTSRWSGVPVTKAVEQLLEANPEWRHLSGEMQVRRIYERLVQEGFDFGGKPRPKGSINMALLRLRRGTQSNGRLHTD